MTRPLALMWMIFLLFGVSHAQASAPPAGHSSVQQVQDQTILWQNGLPYFARFSASSHPRLDLSGEWLFRIDKEDRGRRDHFYDPRLPLQGWVSHPVPGVWNLTDKSLDHYEGVGWYRRSFTVPLDFDGHLNRLVLDGVLLEGEVYLNGQLIGRHSGGFTSWSLDVGSALSFGRENVLVIRVDNRRRFSGLPPLTGRRHPLGWWPWGGLSRAIFLESGPLTTLVKLTTDTDHLGNLRFTGAVFQRAHFGTLARVRVRLLTLGGDELKVLFQSELRLNPNAITLFRHQDRVEGVAPWSPETPQHRYRLEVQISANGASEVQQVELGFRKLEVRGQEIFLNGQPIFLRGMNRHEDDPLLGPVQTIARMEEDLALYRELRVNFSRGAHYPADPRWLEACDRAGVLVVEELPLYQLGYSQASRAAARGPALREAAQIQLLELIERDRNHPSVVMWSLGNENIQYLPSVRRLYQSLALQARQVDPGRPLTFALVLSPWTRFQAREKAPALADILFINEYFGWYVGKPEDVRGALERYHKRFPDKPLVVSELGAGAVLGRPAGSETRPVGMGQSRDYSEAYQAQLYRTQLPLLLNTPYVAGVMPWIFADFRDDKRVDAPIPLMNLKGLLTRERQKKEAFQVIRQHYLQQEVRFQSPTAEAARAPQTSTSVTR